MLKSREEKELMRKKISLALVCLLVLTLMLIWPLHTKPVAASPDVSWEYYGMESFLVSSTELAGTATIGRPSPGSTNSPSWNITFGAPRKLDPNNASSYIVDITVPHVSYRTSPSYMFEAPIDWVNETTSMLVDGYGWIFLNDSYGDVDLYTSNNNTGSYWISPSPKAGTKAADPGQFPYLGADGVAGTADDGFGNGTKDPAGSSVLFMKTSVNSSYANAGTSWKFVPFFSYNWIGVWTTGVAYDIVTESTSLLKGNSTKAVGAPWEFIAGMDPDHPQYKVKYGHPKWNAYVTYAQAWSQHNIYTQFLGGTYLDLLIGETQRLVRKDCVIVDVDGNELVDSMDILVAALAFGSENAHIHGAPDAGPPGGDDKITSDPNWNPRGDASDERGIIDSMDVLVMGLDFGSELRPTCIWRPF